MVVYNNNYNKARDSYMKSIFFRRPTQKTDSAKIRTCVVIRSRVFSYRHLGNKIQQIRNSDCLHLFKVSGYGFEKDKLIQEKIHQF